MADHSSPGAAASGNGNSLAQNWPGWLVALLVIASAIYSFSPRPKPVFPATGLKSDRVLLNDVVVENQRLVTVGEQGTILYADDSRGPWKQASIDQNRGSTLARAAFVSSGVAIAVGHDSWILRSQDRGNTWTEVNFDGERSEPLLGLAGPYNGKLYAFGAFGQFLVSRNNGLNWQSEALVEEGGVAKPEPVATPTEESGDWADIFSGAADIGGGLTESHLNGLVRADDGSLILVGERGLIARSTNDGQSWKVQPKIYNGSFYGALKLSTARLVVHGMRGNVFYSDDNGRSWKQSKVPIANSLFGGTVQRNGEILLVGASNTILLSRDNGASFVRVSQKGPHGLANVLALENGELLKVGEGGMALVRLGQQGGDEGQASEPAESGE